MMGVKVIMMIKTIVVLNTIIVLTPYDQANCGWATEY